MLKEFEKYDNTLAEKLILKRQEQYDIDNKVSLRLVKGLMEYSFKLLHFHIPLKIKECQEKLNGKKYEIESIIKKEKDIQDEFQRALGDSNKYEELLTKILKRKIKRSKVFIDPGKNGWVILLYR